MNESVRARVNKMISRERVPLNRGESDSFYVKIIIHELVVVKTYELLVPLIK